jgi:hypothetical protein
VARVASAVTSARVSALRARRRRTPRRRVLALISSFAATAATLGTASSADATTLNCSADSNVPSLRTTGLTEAAADLVLTCTGGSPTGMGSDIPAQSFDLVADTQVTSRILAEPFAEPLLLLDEPGPGQQDPCQSVSGVCTNKGNDAGSGYYVYQGGTNVNVFQGKVSGNKVSFTNIPVDPPGAGASRVLRFTNLRLNMNALSAGRPVAAGPTQAVVTISSSGDLTLNVSNPIREVGWGQPAMGFGTLSADGSGPVGAGPALASCAAFDTTRVATLRYSEMFGTAFRPRNSATSATSPGALSDQNSPGNMYNSETQFFNHALFGNATRGTLGLAGLADHGTRLKATFNGVPPGVRLFVDTRATTTGANIAQLTADEAGAFSAAGGGAAITEVPLSQGSGTAVWEVLQGDPSAKDNLDGGVYITYPANLKTPGGTVTVSGDFAPTSANPNTSTGPIPSFGAHAATGPLFVVPPCGDNTAPVIASASATPSRFAIDPTSPGEVGVLAKAHKPAAQGTTFRFRVSEASRVLVTIARPRVGRKSGKKCAKSTRANRRKKKCTYYVRAGRFAITASAGANAYPFSGRIDNKNLKPAPYRVTLQASDTSKNRSAPRRFQIRIVKR